MENQNLAQQKLALLISMQIHQWLVVHHQELSYQRLIWRDEKHEYRIRTLNKYKKLVSDWLDQFTELKFIYRSRG